MGLGKLLVSRTMKDKIYSTTHAVLISLIISSNALFAVENKSVARKDELAVSKFFKKSGYSFSNTTESNFYKSKEKRVASNLTGFTFSKPFGKTSSGAAFQVSKDLTGFRETKLTDGVIFLSRKLYSFHERVSFSGASSLVIPISESSRDVVGLRTALTMGPSLGINLGGVGMKYVSLGLSVSATKYFYEYKQNARGNHNVNYKTKYAASISYGPKSWLQLSYAFVVQDREKYNKISTDPVYSNTLSLASSITDKFSTQVGVADAGAVYKENGIDNNVKIFDSDSGSAFFSMSYSL